MKLQHLLELLNGKCEIYIKGESKKMKAITLHIEKKGRTSHEEKLSQILGNIVCICHLHSPDFYEELQSTNMN